MPCYFCVEFRAMLNELVQIGVGAQKAEPIMEFLKEGFGFDIKAAEDEGAQPKMNMYTNDELMHRRSILVGNFQGGALIEIVEPETTAVKKPTPIKLGDYGIHVTKIRSHNIEASFNRIRTRFGNRVSDLYTDPLGRKTFFVKDPEENLYQVSAPIEELQTCLSQGKDTGGVLGCSIGVSDLDRAKKFYSEVLGYTVKKELLHGDNSWNEDFLGPEKDVSRVFMVKHTDKTGLLSNLLGDSEIELVKTHGERIPERIFENRRWGDCGFVHVCFNSNDSAAAKQYLTGRDVEIVTDSRFNWNGLDSDFMYIEDPDRCFIEVTSLYSIPIFMPLGIKYKVNKSKGVKPLHKNWFTLLKLKMAY